MTCVLIRAAVMITHMLAAAGVFLRVFSQKYGQGVVTGETRS